MLGVVPVGDGLMCCRLTLATEKKNKKNKKIKRDTVVKIIKSQKTWPMLPD